jgi:hypothetical protein
VSVIVVVVVVYSRDCSGVRVTLAFSGLIEFSRILLCEGTQSRSGLFEAVLLCDAGATCLVCFGEVCAVCVFSGICEFPGSGISRTSGDSGFVCDVGVLFVCVDGLGESGVDFLGVLEFLRSLLSGFSEVPRKERLELESFDCPNALGVAGDVIDVGFGELRMEVEFPDLEMLPFEVLDFGAELSAEEAPLVDLRVREEIGEFDEESELKVKKG